MGEMIKERRSGKEGRKVESVEEFQGVQSIGYPHVTPPQAQYESVRYLLLV
jgi:hypothetical protein